LWMSFVIACSWAFILLQSFSGQILILNHFAPWSTIAVSVICTWCITSVLAIMPCIKSNMSVLDEVSK
jgi:hypothetical protein